MLDIPNRPTILTEKVPPCAHTVQNFYVNALPGHSNSWEVQDDWGIMGGEEEDTVTVEVGGVESFLFVTTINHVLAAKAAFLSIADIHDGQPE